MLWVLLIINFSGWDSSVSKTTIVGYYETKKECEITKSEIKLMHRTSIVCALSKENME